MLGWASENAAIFDLTKTKLVQFPECGRESPIRVTANDIIFEADELTMWQGIHLDSKLSFRNHVDKWCSKVLRIAQLMSKLNLILRGVIPKPLIKALEVSIVSVATFGVEV